MLDLVCKALHDKEREGKGKNVTVCARHVSFRWPISEKRGLDQRTGNARQQPFGVASLRVDIHEGGYTSCLLDDIFLVSS